MLLSLIPVYPVLRDTTVPWVVLHLSNVASVTTRMRALLFVQFVLWDIIVEAILPATLRYLLEGVVGIDQAMHLVCVSMEHIVELE